MKLFCNRFVVLFVCAALVISQTSCSKEKAEAVKTAANAFNTQAQAALDKLDTLFKESVAFTPESKEEFVAGAVRDLQRTKFGEEEIRKMLKFSTIEDLDSSGYSQKLNEIRSTYQSFADMYTNLPQGNLFAGDAVARSERLAITLTAQMYALGMHIKKYPFVSSAKLHEIRRKREVAMQEPQSAVRDLKLRAVAEDILNLKNATDAANSAAIAECAKGALLGLEVAKLTRDYKKLSVNDILQIMKETLPAVNHLTGMKTESLLGKLTNIQTAVRSDPDWARIAGQVEDVINRTPPSTPFPGGK